MRDMGIFFQSSIDHDLSFMSIAYSKTQKKESTSLFSMLYRSNSLNNSGELQVEILKAVKSMYMNPVFQHKDYQYALKVLADIENSNQDKLKHLEWAQSYKKEYQNTIGYLQSLEERVKND